jgi:hypothetical protein
MHMLQITADVFSGRVNPMAVISDEQEARSTLRELITERSLVTDTVPAQAGLGFRGILIEPMNDELGVLMEGARSFYLPVGPLARSARANELAERLIGLATRTDPGSVPSIQGEAMTPFDENLQNFLTGQLERPGRVTVTDSRETEPSAEQEPTEKSEVGAAVTCFIELAPYNPGFWNNDASILRNNNCYNYASNKRTDTFAQPGRGCGQMYQAITCPEVTRAALCDGLHRRFDCFPDAEIPRYLVAMAVIPGGGDYHWYRKMKEGFWGHKPGGTPVRNVDNSGRVINDPATCDRGPYTIFCGYFYTCRSQRIQ